MKKKIKVARVEWRSVNSGIFNLNTTFLKPEDIINEYLEKNNINVDDVISVQYPADNAYETSNIITITYKTINLKHFNHNL